MPAASAGPVRRTGATTTLRPGEAPSIVSATGGELVVTTHVSQPGYNPLDLLYASLSACVALSVRIAAQRAGVLDALGEIRTGVTGAKAVDGPSRIERLDISVAIDGDIDETVKRQLAYQAETEICTVSNTLRGLPQFTMSYLPGDSAP